MSVSEELYVLLIGDATGAVAAYNEATVAGDRAAVAAERAGKATAAAGAESAAAGGRTAVGAAEAERSSGRWVQSAAKSKAAFKGLGLAAAAIFIGSVYSAVKFEQAMELVHTQAGASQAEVKKLSGAVLDLATATATGPNKLAEGLYHIESVGYRGAAAMQILKVAALGAKTGNADLDATTYALTSVMNTFGLKASDAGRTMAQLNAIVGTGDMRMKDLNGAIGSGFLAAADTFGISLQSAGAALAYLTDRGSKADESATRLKMSFALLGAPSHKAAGLLTAIGISAEEVHARTGAMTKALEKSGLTTLQLSEDLKKPNGLGVALQDLKTHLENSGLSASQAATLISKAFGGGRSGAAIMSLYAHLDVLKQKFDAQGVAATHYGEAVQATQKTAAYAIDQMKASVEVLAIKLGTALLPAVTAVSKAVAAAAVWLTKHKDVATALAYVLGGIVVAALAAVVVAIIAATSAVTAIILGIGALAGALVYCYNHFRTFRAIVDTVFAAIVQIVRTFVGLWLREIEMILRPMATLAEALHLPFAKGLRSAQQEVEKFRVEFDQKLKGVQDTALMRATATAVNINQPLADRLPQYQAIATRYKTSLDSVLRAAGVSSHQYASAMGLEMAQGLSGGLPRFAAIGAQYARLPAAAIQAQDGAAFAAAAALGGALGAGLLVGLAARRMQVASAAAAVGAAAVSGLNAHIRAQSPSKASTYLGQMLGEGLAVGMESKRQRVRDAARALGLTVTEYLRTAAGRAEAAGRPLHGPGSRGGHPYVRHPRATGPGSRGGTPYVRHPRVNHHLGGSSSGNSAAAAAHRAATAHAAALAKMLADAKAHERIRLDMIAIRERAELKVLGRQITAQKAAIATMLQDRKALGSERDTFATDLGKQIQGTAANIVDIFKALPADVADPVAALMTSLKAGLARTKEFGQDLKTLTAQGASKDLVTQLAAAGADGAKGLADALVAQGPTAIKAADDVLQQVRDAATNAASSIADGYYKAGLASMDAQIAGMQAREGAMQAEVDRIQAILAQLTVVRAQVSGATTVGGVKAIDRKFTGTLAPKGKPVARSMAGDTYVLNISTDGGRPAVDLARELAPLIRAQIAELQRTGR